MIELVSFCFCQTQSLAGSPTWWQVVRQHVWFTLGKVSVDRVENLVPRNPFHDAANQDWIV